MGKRDLLKKVNTETISNKVDNQDKYSSTANAVIDGLKDFTPEMTKVVTKEIVKEVDSGKVLTAPSSKFVSYKNEKLRLTLLEGLQKERLKESIQKNGIMNPIICVPTNTDKYMVIAGHNRVSIAEELNIEVPYILKNDISEEEMDLICIDTNLLNRQLEDYKPSQLAYIFNVKFNEDKYKRNDDHESTSEKMSKEYKLSRMQINNYKRLYLLDDDVMRFVDDKKISIKIGVQISYFDKEIQKFLCDKVLDKNYKFNEKNLIDLKQKLEAVDESKKKEYVEEYMEQFCKPSLQIPTSYMKFKDYIPSNLKSCDVEKYIIEALKAYRK